MDEPLPSKLRRVFGFYAWVPPANEAERVYLLLLRSTLREWTAWAVILSINFAVLHRVLLPRFGVLLLRPGDRLALDALPGSLYLAGSLAFRLGQYSELLAQLDPSAASAEQRVSGRAELLAEAERRQAALRHVLHSQFWH